RIVTWWTGADAVNGKAGVGLQDGKRHRLGLAPLLRLAEGSSVFVIVLIAWQIAVWALHPPAYVLPAPRAVWDAIWNPALHWPRSILITVEEILGGFIASGLAGVGLGIIIAWTPLFERTILPFLVVFNILPKVAIAPLFIIYLGYGVFPNMVIA